MGLVDFSLGDVGNLFTSLREAITGKKIEDPTERAKIELQLEQLEQALKMGQIEINKAEAKNPNWFVAGWRPFIGWTCGVALAYYYVASPFLHSIFGVFNLNYQLPEIETGALFNLLIAMLGLAGYRTYEKTKKVQDLH